MKILYLSCHSVLEYDELRLFESLNLEYFSLGSYIIPTKPVDPIRPALTRVVDPELHSLAPDRMNIPKEFIDRFDVVIVMHMPEWIYANWDRMKHKTVIWRTIGQSTPSHERQLQRYKAEGLKIVRYSPTESRMESFCGQDAVIRFYKDESEFSGWTGSGTEMITIAQNMKQRAEFCNYSVFEQVSTVLPTKLYGTTNESSGELSGGLLTYEEMKEKYRTGRVYFYTGTQPAAYTLNFMEAFMTGIPIVAIGENYANSLGISGKSYEVADIFDMGRNLGMVGRDIESLKHYVQLLYNNRTLAEEISRNARAKAVELFGMETAKKAWSDFLTSL